MIRTRACIALAAAALLGGCRVDTFIGIGPDDDPPSVSLAASPSVASRGETIGLVAAAADDFRVIEVEFYRLDVGGRTFLGEAVELDFDHPEVVGRDGDAPYALDTVVPTGASGEVRYLGRAIDDARQIGESLPVSVIVR
jgi:hypothetical protein